jgi:hypothetical protein
MGSLPLNSIEEEEFELCVAMDEFIFNRNSRDIFKADRRWFRRGGNISRPFLCPFSYSEIA